MLCFFVLHPRIPAIVFVIALLSCGLAGQGYRFDKVCFGPDQAEDAINDWRKENKDFVVIDKAAAARIKQGITGRDCDYKNAIPEPGSKNDFIVGSYLYELRDRKYRELGSPPILSSDFRIGLELGDVRALPFKEFSKELGSAIWQDPGELTVDSSPPGANITIDSKPRGITKKDFVVSKGKHSILVRSDNLSCAETVEVKDEPLTYACTRKASDPKSNPEAQKH